MIFRKYYKIKISQITKIKDDENDSKKGYEISQGNY